MLRLLAAIGFVASVLLFAVGLIVSLNSDATTAAGGAHWIEGGFITTAAGLFFLALEGVTVPRT